jgi:NAD(P)-dependent dehydrogenase (short-subunit alcohol dehydrogenase family)
VTGSATGIAAAVAFLASDDARWVSGQNMRVKGETV